MAMNETTSGSNKLSRTWNLLLEGRPLIALAAALITTNGHPINLREMGAARGWVLAEFFSLQSTYLCSIGLAMIACPALGQRWSCRALAQTGLLLASIGALLNGFLDWSPQYLCVAGPVVAGVGCGLAIFFSPRMLGPRWELPAIWATILVPMAGPPAIAMATMFRETSDWRSAFYFQALCAAIALAILLSMDEAPEKPPPRRATLAFFPALIVAVFLLLYILHWGQLHGWLESPDIVLAFVCCGTAFGLSLWLAWPYIDVAALKENWPRLALFFFGGASQFFVGAYVVNTYASNLMNLNAWQRAMLILPMPIGITAALAVSQWQAFRRLVLGLPGAIVGLLMFAVGLWSSLRLTMNWPYWYGVDIFDLNWFVAPSAAVLAPTRFLMGFGVGILFRSMSAPCTPNPEREEKVRPVLTILQFLGGGISTGAFVTFLLIGHQIHYSYSADRDYVQPDEVVSRQSNLSEQFYRGGEADPERIAQAAMYRSVNYEAENLTFASVYSVFFVVALALAGMCAATWVCRRWQGVPSVAPRSEEEFEFEVDELEKD